MKRLHSRIGYIAALFAYLMYSSMDSCVKLLGPVPAFQIIAATYGIALSMVLAFFWWRHHNWHFLAVPAAQRGWLAIRCLLFFSVSVLAFMGLKQVTLPSFYAVFFTSPLLVTLLAAIWLRETVQWQQWLLLLLGFAGVLIVFRPWSAHWQPGLILVGLAALVHATNNVLARRLCQHISAATNLVWTLTAGVLMAVLLAGPAWQILTSPQWHLLLLAGLFTGLANLAFIYAIYQLKAAPLAINHYSQIIWGILFGFIFWHSLPDTLSFAGTALIILAGALMMRSQIKATPIPPIV